MSEYVGCYIRTGTVLEQLKIDPSALKNGIYRTATRKEKNYECKCLILPPNGSEKSISSLRDLCTRLLMKYIHQVEFEGLPEIILEEIFFKNFSKFGLLMKPSCLECWNSAVRIVQSMDDPPVQQIINLTNTIDFFSDQIFPLLEPLTVLDLSGQGIHDQSGILNTLSEMRMLERLVLRKNLISEKGIRSFMLPVNVKRSSLQRLIEIDLRENQIKTLECKWFDGLTNLKTLFMDPIKQVYANKFLSNCQKPSEHTINCSQTVSFQENFARKMVLEIFYRLMKVEKTAKTNSNKSKKTDDFTILCSVHKPDPSKAKKRKNIISKPAAKKGRFKM